MFGRRLKLFELFGFNIYVDLSWLLIAILVTWSLATGVFPGVLQGLAPWSYWCMALAGALGLFASIVFHEFAHSLVARTRGMEMRGITLFVFGGVAEMAEEPPDGRSEFLVAVAGPLASVFLAGCFFGLDLLGRLIVWPTPVIVVLMYLEWINLMLAAFNLIPAFPLDGGRVLRAALWAWKKNLRWATKIVSWMGAGFGFLLLGVGIFAFFVGNFIAGIWWFLLGLFLQQAARATYQQLLMRQTLEGERVRRFMHAETDAIEPTLSIQQFVNDYVYRHHFKFYPVARGGQLLGCVSVQDLKQVPKSEWSHRAVGEVVTACSEENTIQADADAVQALGRMNRGRTSRLIVVDGSNHLAGILALKDLLNFLSLKSELEGV